jgi:hypothetical protein
VFEDWVLRKVFKAKRVEVKGQIRKLLSEELNNSYLSGNVIRQKK